MLKITGAVLVVISAFLIGLMTKKGLKDKCKITEDLIGGLSALKEEIRYTSDYLEKSIQKSIQLSGTAKPFFELVHDGMLSGKTSEEAWEKALSVIHDTETEGLLADTGKQLGKTDVTGQNSMLENCIVKLEMLHKKQTEYYEKQGSMYPKLGAASGILIAILLI